MKDRGGAISRDVRTLFRVGTLAALTDGQLLERFANQTGEAAEMAFAALVERHGPMVFRVCRRVLGDAHDAQDAFQATFLVLVRRVGSIRRRDSVASWLHGVAYRTAASARSAAARRKRHEGWAAQTMVTQVAGDWNDTGPILHEELARLPEPYRAAVVLCCLEGLGPDQVATQMGCPVGTVKSRLARGRELLRARLVRRGLAPVAGLPLVGLSAYAAQSMVPIALVISTVRLAVQFTAGAASPSAAALTEGVLRTMWLTKLKGVGVGAVILVALATGAAVIAQQLESSPALHSATPLPMNYELRIWKDGEPKGEPIATQAPWGKAVRIDSPHGPIEIQPISKGEGRQTQVELLQGQLEDAQNRLKEDRELFDAFLSQEWTEIVDHLREHLGVEAGIELRSVLSELSLAKADQKLLKTGVHKPAIREKEKVSQLEQRIAKLEKQRLDLIERALRGPEGDER